MIGGGISLFGFDLFNHGRKAMQADTEKSSPRPSASESDAARDERERDWQHSESFFWGMYPVY